MSTDHESLIASDALDKVTAPLSQAWTLPPDAYTKPMVFAAEIKSIFSRDWLCVARVDQLPQPGDYVCADLPDQPIVITRDQQGVLHALSRICLHRAMPLIEGQGNTTRLVCPYHHWTYELNGTLRSAPMMEGVENFASDQCLPELRLEVWQGFIFVNLDETAAPLSPRLAGLDALVENYDFSDMVVLETIEYDSPWNWKILVENFMEAYHHIGPHKNTFEPAYPARESRIVDNEDKPWVFLRMPGEHAVSNEEGAFPALTAEQRHDLIAACVFPTLLFGASASGAAWYQLEPLGVDRMRLRIHALYNPAVTGEASDDDRAGAAAMLRAIHEEDIAVNQGPWQGLQAGLTRQGRLSLYEKGIWQLNQLWVAGLDLK
jgi:phenylpropionate dioxygenase-like ring-hydroxylating dioxygenase large terminal subunit